MKLILIRTYVAPEYFVDQVNNHNVAHLLVTMSIEDTKILAVFKSHSWQEENQLNMLPR